MAHIIMPNCVFPVDPLPDSSVMVPSFSPPCNAVLIDEEKEGMSLQ